MNYFKFLVVLAIIFLSGINPEYFTVSGFDFALLILVVLFVLFYFSVRIGSVFKLYSLESLRVLLFIILLSGVSLFWSSNFGDGLVTFFKLVYLTIVASLIPIRLKLFDFVQCILIAILVISVFTLMYYFLSPQDVASDRDGSWHGLYLHKNSFARALGYGFIATIILSFWSRRTIYLVAALPILACLLLTESATTLVACFGVGILIFIFSLTKLRKYHVNICTFIVFIFIPLLPLLAFLLTPVLNFLLKLLGRNVDRTTFMVRQFLWEDLFLAIREKWVLGYGLEGYWVPGGREFDIIGNSNLQWLVNQAHNGYIDLMLQYGVLGIVLIVWFLFNYFRKLSAINSRYSLMIGLSFMAYFLFINNSYSAMYSQLTLPWFLTTVIFLFLSKLKAR